jgi:hypothetical protein
MEGKTKSRIKAVKEKLVYACNYKKEKVLTENHGEDHRTTAVD